MVVIVMPGILFLAGVLVGMGAMVCLGIAREESRKSLRKDPPGPAAAATRTLVGFHSRPPRRDETPGGDAWMNRANDAGGWRPTTA
jgi:hypothetical protein